MGFWRSSRSSKRSSSSTASSAPTPTTPRPSTQRSSKPFRSGASVPVPPLPPAFAMAAQNGNGAAAEPQMPPPKRVDPNIDPVGYLKSLLAVRERCSLVLARAKKNDLLHFEVDMAKFGQTVKWVVSIIKRDFAPDYDSIPPHGRWQHFDVGGNQRVAKLLALWPDAQVDAKERTRRLIDMFLVSVLLDAGAGVKWTYTSKENGRRYTRSEGLAVASLEMFRGGAFSGDKGQPFQVDAAGLKGLTPASLADGLQVTADNPIAGLEGRAELLVRLGHALEANRQIFGATARPGNMIDHLLAHETTRGGAQPTIDTTTLWDTLMTGLGPIWPAKRTQLNGVSLGDSWPCASLPQDAAPWEAIAPFHKLTQWLCYSLMPPMTRMLGARFAHAELLTGLPEYRNGGLLVDTGLLTLREPERRRGEEAYKVHMAATGAKCMEVVPVFAPDDDVVVEWRCVTVGFLDEIHAAVNEELGLFGRARLSLAQVLEAGTWKGGREIAEVSRPNTKEPPIMTISDGTVF